MDGSAGTVLLIMQVLHLELLLGKTTNLWNDEQFRNEWDTVNQWGTTLGTLVGVIGSVIAARGGSDSAQRDNGLWTLAGGVGIAGVAQLMGGLLGKDQGDAMKHKAQVIEFTRKAYDDLGLRIDQVETFERSNNDFLESLAAFKVKFNDPSKWPGSSDADRRRNALVELGVMTGQFTAALNQVPALLKSYSVLVDKYSASPVPIVQTDMQSTVKPTVAKAEKNYHARVKDFLSQQQLILEIFGR
jgi:hypothetical protein